MSELPPPKPKPDMTDNPIANALVYVGDCIIYLTQELSQQCDEDSDKQTEGIS